MGIDGCRWKGGGEGKLVVVKRVEVEQVGKVMTVETGGGVIGGKRDEIGGSLR